MSLIAVQCSAVMAPTAAEKAFCVLEFEKSHQAHHVIRKFKTKYGKQYAPSATNIIKWHKKFTNSGCLCKGKSSGRPSVSEDVVDKIRDVYLSSPKTSTRRVSQRLQMPQQTVWKVLRKRLKMKPYKLQLLQHLKRTDKTKRATFCMDMQENIDNEDGFLEKVIFSDEATFHLSGKVNKQNVRIWGTENPREFVEHMRDSPKVNVFCAMSKEKVYGPEFFDEPTVTGNSYLKLLKKKVMPKLKKDSVNFIFQQDGAPPHWKTEVRDYLDSTLPHRWIGRASDSNLVFARWPPRSPDLTPCDFFLWGYVKDKVYVPPLPESLDELKR